LDLELRAMYRDVVRRLRLTRRESVLEIGCGVGLFAPQIASRSAEYVGVDFAAKAIAVARQRSIPAAAGRCEFLERDALVRDVLADLYGRFDRVLMYAVLHYARNEDEGMRLLETAARCVRPGGFLLVGNVPLDDVSRDVKASWLSQGSRIGRLVACATWILRGSTAVGRTPWWKARASAMFYLKALLRRIREPRPFATATLPARYCLPLTRSLIERWLAVAVPGAPYRWVSPSPASPLALTRGDLLVYPQMGDRPESLLTVA
jgi:SAM-dependent methyltransferase